ncbi:MAG: hypothetical protein COU69_02655 [Candidatus Pacebacteria bacterium CG10_big_fil_rev_8_21_14_0_10_56_10]|nr:MAG: hypothetical protein COU69_02655 [Candidatus Pacebacteria bacterium CG10_big_fil_rev_8_21_14_0_10_56_10]
MSLTSLLIQFGAGLAVVLLAADVLIIVTKELAYRWKISPLILSLLIVAFGTNLPELTVLLAALGNGDGGLALGNIVGSNISNLTLVFGLGVLAASPRIGTTKTPKNVLMLVVMTVLFVTIRLLGVNPQLEIAALLGVLTYVLIYQYVLGVAGSKSEDKKLFQHKPHSFLAAIGSQGSVLASLLLLIGAVIGLVVGSNTLVGAVQGLSVALGVATSVLGLTLVATATSLPELVTLLVAGSQRQPKIMVGTLIGSNIYNLGLFVPIISFFRPRPEPALLDVFYLVVTTSLFAGIVLSSTGRQIPRKFGVLAVIVYFIFIGHTYFLTF